VSTLLRALLTLVSKWNLAALARLLFLSAMCSPADIAKAAEAIWPWLRGLLDETQLDWPEVVANPKHEQLREIAEEMAGAALGATCPGSRP
jgi:hypothetical protein